MVDIQGGLERQRLIQFHFAPYHLLFQPSEIFHCPEKALSKHCLFSIYMAQELLHMDELYLISGEGNFHGTHILQDPVPLVYTNILLNVGYGIHDLL